MSNESTIKQIINECKKRLDVLSKKFEKKPDPRLLDEIKKLTELLTHAIKKQEELEDFKENFFLIDKNIIKTSGVINYLQNNLNYNFLNFTTQNSKIMDVINESNINIDKNQILSTKHPNRLFEFKKALGKSGKVGIPYIFEIEKKSIIIKASNKIELYSRNHADLDRYDCFKYYKVDKKECIPEKKNLELITGSSEYINETIIGYILNFIFFNSYFKTQSNYSLEGVPGNMSDFANSVFQIGYFQNPDQKVGYNVMEKCDNTLDKLFKDINCSDCDFLKIKFILNGKQVNDKNKIMLMLLQQITSTLEILKTDYDFNHGDLKGGNFFYKIDDAYLKIDYPLNAYEFTKGTRNKKYLCKTNIRLKIADYGKSSITFKKTHYYCNDTKLNLHKLSQVYYTPQKLSLESLSPEGKYLFDTDTPHGIEISLRHLACPYFLSADYYVLITSLCLTSNSFYDFVYNYKILESMDLDIGNELSKEIFRKRPESVVTAFDLLRGKYFKCSAISDVSKLILKYF